MIEPTARELLEKGNREMYGALQRANAIIGQQADEMKGLQDKIDKLKAELGGAVRAGEYMVQLCEQNTEGPGGRQEWSAAVLAHCYAAMSFVGRARKVLEETNEIEHPKDEESAGAYSQFPTTAEAVGGL